MLRRRQRHRAPVDETLDWEPAAELPDTVQSTERDQAESDQSDDSLASTDEFHFAEVEAAADEPSGSDDEPFALLGDEPAAEASFEAEEPPVETASEESFAPEEAADVSAAGIETVSDDVPGSDTIDFDASDDFAVAETPAADEADEAAMAAGGELTDLLSSFADDDRGGADDFSESPEETAAPDVEEAAELVTQQAAIDSLISAADDGNADAQFELGAHLRNRLVCRRYVPRSDSPLSGRRERRPCLGHESPGAHVLPGTRRAAESHPSGQALPQRRQVARPLRPKCPGHVPGTWCGCQTRYGKRPARYYAGAEAGSPACQTNLALCYLRGRGVAQQPRIAVRWLEKAAEQDYGYALLCLGACYEGGHGVKRDPKQAEAYYRLRGRCWLCIARGRLVDPHGPRRSPGGRRHRSHLVAPRGGRRWRALGGI